MGEIEGSGSACRGRRFGAEDASRMGKIHRFGSFSARSNSERTRLSDEEESSQATRSLIDYSTLSLSNFSLSATAKRSNSRKRRQRHSESQPPSSNEVNRASERSKKRGDFNPNPHKGGIWYEGVRYGSAAEAAVGKMMERYIPGFKIEELLSFQVPAYDYKKGTMRTLDFKVRDIVLEYHPPRVWRNGHRFGDVQQSSEFFEIKRQIKAATTKEEKRAIRQNFEKKLTKEYADMRRELLDMNSALRNCELIVATSPDDFFKKVLKRLGEKTPPMKELKQEYNEVLQDVLRVNKHWGLKEAHKQMAIDRAA